MEFIVDGLAETLSEQYTRARVNPGRPGSAAVEDREVSPVDDGMESDVW